MVCMQRVSGKGHFVFAVAPWAGRSRGLDVRCRCYISSCLRNSVAGFPPHTPSPRPLAGEHPGTFLPGFQYFSKTRSAIDYTSSLRRHSSSGDYCIRTNPSRRLIEVLTKDPQQPISPVQTTVITPLPPLNLEPHLAPLR